MRNVIFFNNHDHWPLLWPRRYWLWPLRELALASKTTGLGLGLEHAVLEPIPGFFAVKFLRSQINRWCVWVVSFARWRNYFAELIKIKLTDVFGTKYSKNHANCVGGRFNLQLWANGSLVFLGHRVYDAQKLLSNFIKNVEYFVIKFN